MRYVNMNIPYVCVRQRLLIHITLTIIYNRDVMLNVEIIIFCPLVFIII